MIPTTCTGALVHPRHSTYCVHAQVSPYSPRNGIISECITGCYAPSIFILTLVVLLVARVWPWERPRSTRFLRGHGETLRQSTEHLPKNVLSPNNTPNSWAMPCLLVSLRKLIPRRASCPTSHLARFALRVMLASARCPRVACSGVKSCETWRSMARTVLIPHR